MLQSSEPLELLYLPTEIIFCILAFLGKKCRISATFVCKLFSTIILQHLGYFKVDVRSRENLLKLNGSPLLKNTKITIIHSPMADDFKNLSGSIHTIDISTIDVTDAGLEALSGVHTINLSYCEYITDKGVIAISGSVHKIQLDGCDITDKSVKSLTNASAISFSECSKITDEGVKYLLTQNQTTNKIRKINLGSCSQISNNVLKLLAGIPCIDMYNCSQLEDDTLSCLAGVHQIDLYGCRSVTNDGIKLLAGVKVIDISELDCVDDSTLKALAGVHTIFLDSTSVTDDGLQYLVGVKVISLCKCRNITDKGVSSLIGVKKMSLKGCSSITDDGVVNLTSLDYINYSSTQITKEMIESLGCKTMDRIKWPAF